MLCVDPITVSSWKAGFSLTRFMDPFCNVVPCGRCRSCRWNMRRQWALRCALEAQMHERNCFINLTYRDSDLPKGGTLVKKHLQGFIKRLRSDLEYHDGVRIRHYAAGEYGSDKGRPHYHVLIFGFDFDDKTVWRTSKKGYPLYRSSRLEKLWRFGFSEIGEVNFKTAGYVAGYISKKITGPLADDHYGNRIPEFSLQSTKPGIGVPWMVENPWIWKEDLIRYEGRSFRPPRAFEKAFEKADPEGYAVWCETVKAFRTRLDVRGEPADDFDDEVE